MLSNHKPKPANNIRGHWLADLYIITGFDYFELAFIYFYNFSLAFSHFAAFVIY